MREKQNLVTRHSPLVTQRSMTSIGQNIEILCSEHGLDRDLVIEAMKDAVKAAARKQFKTQDKTGDSIQVDWNVEEGMIEISAHKEVVLTVENPSAEMSLAEAQELAGDEVELGDVLEIPLPTEELGRIAAQTAKQILVQKVREAVRSKVYDEYFERIGEIFNGQVKRFERGDMIVELSNNLESVVPKREQVRSENWSINDRVRVVIKDVSKELRGQQIVASRASAELLKRLFEMEVPEIYDGTVVIKSAVREPGDRAKIAVASNEKDVDPVGACVGMKGSRVQSIIKELRGEKIDIIEWSDEPSIFAANALSPAKVSQVRITDIDARKMEVIVPEDQLSLAIGKFGQNVRLATKLVGWNIDIISEEVLKTEIAKQMSEMIASGEPVSLAALQVVNEAQADALAEKGVEDISGLAALSIDDLVETLDISLDEAEEILGKANSILEARDAKTAAEETEADSESETVSEETETVEESVETEETADEDAVSETENESDNSDEVTEESDSDETDDASETEDSTAEGYDEAVAGVSDEDDETAEDDSEDVYDEVETETSEITDSDREEIAEVSNELLIEPSPELNSKMISGEDSSEVDSDEAENVTEKTNENSADENSDEEENR